MTAAGLIAEVLAAGGKVTVDGPDLVLTAPKPLPGELVAKVKAHKPEVLAALAAPARLWWRVAITEPSGRTVEEGTPGGLTLADWQAYAIRYHGPDATVTPIERQPEPGSPVSIEEALRAAVEGVAGLSPEVFRSLLSAEDLADIEGGHYPPATLRAYAESMAEGVRSGRIRVLAGRTA